MKRASHIREQAVVFECHGDRLVGVLSRPVRTEETASVAVLIAVGGPQYRVGSHRQFVLLARALAQSGYPSLRFDYRGMGDSEGAQRNFEQVADDMGAALQALRAACPANTRMVVWGLCDAASAAMMFATADHSVVGLAAVNPFVRSDESLAAVTVKHYYLERFFQPDFWRNVFTGRFDWRSSLRSVFANLRATLFSRRSRDVDARQVSFQDRMAHGLSRFDGKLLLLLSGADLTAKEFLQYSGSDVKWRKVLNEPSVQRVDFPDADHTFSLRRWSDALEEEIVSWLDRLSASVDAAQTEPERVMNMSEHP